MEKQNETKKCKHCQTVIPKKAKVCPQCRKKQGGILKWVIIVLIIFIILGSCGNSDNSSDKESTDTNTKVVQKSEETSVEKVVEDEKVSEEVKVEENSVEQETISEPQETEEEYKATCEEYKYKDVLRNPSDYVGKRIKITVKISSVHEASWLNDGKYYFAYSNDEYDWWSGDRYGVFDRRAEQNPKLLEDDIITVYGEISDPEQTTSLIVTSSEVFCIDMKYIDFISE